MLGGSIWDGPISSTGSGKEGAATSPGTGEEVLGAVPAGTGIWVGPVHPPALPEADPQEEPDVPAPLPVPEES
ncbi:MAG: hypothetical protein ACLFQR_08885 [Desulfovibrionales bacterium]